MKNIMIVIMVLAGLGTVNGQKPPIPRSQGPSPFRINTITPGDIADVQIDNRLLSGSPEEMARQFLARNAEALGMKQDLSDIVTEKIQESPGSYHVRLFQTVQGIPVYNSQIVISISHSNEPEFFMSDYHQEIDIEKVSPTILKKEAISLAMTALETNKTYAEPEAQLYILPTNQGNILGYRVMIPNADPYGDWLVFINAKTGDIIWINEITMYYQGSGYVFKPDPLTTAQHYYGSDGYVDNNDANSTALTNQRVSVTLNDISYSGGLYRLEGPYVTISDFESPTSAPATSSNAEFYYYRLDNRFEDVSVYYHIDTNQRYLQSLGFSNIQNNSIEADPYGLNGADNSHYLPGTNRLAFGEGGVDDAEDADVILHEYGHAIQYDQISGDFQFEMRCISEGFGDYWAGSYSAALSNWEKDFVFTWDAGLNSSGSGDIWSGRRLDGTKTYDDYDDQQSIYYNGSIWSATLWDIRDALGATKADKIIIKSHYYLSNSANMNIAANAIIDANEELYNGYKCQVLRTVLENRGFETHPCAPSGLNIVNEDEMDEPVELDWNNVAGATSYKIYWRILYYPGYPPGDWSHIGTTSQSYYTDYAHYVSYLSQHYLQYYVTAVNCAGESAPSYTATCHGDVYKRIVEAEGEDIPDSYGLEPNYPNPFNPVTAIRYDLPEASRVSLVIYDIAGREVRRWNLQEQAGYRHVMWDARDQSGRMVPTGIYIYRLAATSTESDKRFTANRKMLLMK